MYVYVSVILIHSSGTFNPGSVILEVRQTETSSNCHRRHILDESPDSIRYTMAAHKPSPARAATFYLDSILRAGQAGEERGGESDDISTQFMLNYKQFLLLRTFAFCCFPWFQKMWQSFDIANKMRVNATGWRGGSRGNGGQLNFNFDCKMESAD